MEKIIEKRASDAFFEDTQHYAIAINRSQAVPDVRDGLKKVARALVMAYYDGKYTCDRPFIKSAKVVGECMGNYHPHGDSSIYGVLVNRSQWFKTKSPLFEGHGNYGNMQGKGAAAMRYTETRLSKFAQECIVGDLMKSEGIVDWVNNFDDSRKIVEYFAVKVPLLLINGTFGIGIGMRSEVPTHNFNEVMDATINVLKDPEAPVVLIPDHCMPCDIIDTDWEEISRTGIGKYRVRGRVDIEWDKDIPKLIISSVPNNVTLFVTKGEKTEGVIAKIYDMVKEQKLPQISKIDTDSKGDTLRYVITLKKGSDPNYVRDFLYKNTLLESSYSINFEVLEGIEPIRMSYKSYIEYFIDFNIILKIRKYASLYSEVKTKWREKQLYIMVMESGEIENIQKRIRSMTDISPEAMNEFMEWLIARFNVTDIEAKFIMKMDQMKTAKGYLNLYKSQLAEMETEMMTYFEKMNNEAILKQEILDDLIEIRKKYDTPRVCRVIKATSDIPSGEFKIVITENNYIKKIGVEENALTVRGDVPKFVMKVQNTEHILLFDSMGKVFKYPVHKIPMAMKNNPGVDLKVLIKNCTSNIISLMYEPTVHKFAKMKHKHFMTVLTKGNCIKKLDLADFLTATPSGIFFTKLANGDEVKDIAIVQGGTEIIIHSHKKALCFNLDEVPLYKRTAMGVIAMDTSEELDGLSILFGYATDILVVTKNGKVNRFNISGLKRSNRNRAGSSVIRLSANDSIVGIYGVDSNMQLSLVTTGGNVNINVAEIPVSSSVGAGTKLTSGRDTVIKAKVITA